MSEPVRVEIGSESEITLKRIGYVALQAKGGWRVFFRPHLCLRRLAGWRERVEVPLREEGMVEHSFEHGFHHGTKLMDQVEIATAEFSDAFVSKLIAAGFTVRWKAYPEEVALPGGATVGPGVAVWIVGKGGLSAHDSEREAISLGNAMNFCRGDYWVEVERLEYGIVSGGPLHEAVVQGGVDQADSVADAEKARQAQLERDFIQRRVALRMLTDHEHVSSKKMFEVKTTWEWKDSDNDNTDVRIFWKFRTEVKGRLLGYWKPGSLGTESGELVLDTSAQAGDVLRRNLEPGKEHSFSFQLLAGEFTQTDEVDSLRFTLHMPTLKEIKATSVEEFKKALNEPVESAAGGGFRRKVDELLATREEVAAHEKIIEGETELRLAKIDQDPALSPAEKQRRRALVMREKERELSKLRAIPVK